SDPGGTDARLQAVHGTLGHPGDVHGALCVARTAKLSVYTSCGRREHPRGMVSRTRAATTRYKWYSTKPLKGPRFRLTTT
ncbi:unnamed protein product, partial [Ixodes persulcatus]